jgi:hypothetical protein
VDMDVNDKPNLGDIKLIFTTEDTESTEE